MRFVVILMMVFGIACQPAAAAVTFSGVSPGTIYIGNDRGRTYEANLVFSEPADVTDIFLVGQFKRLHCDDFDCHYSDYIETYQPISFTKNGNEVNFRFTFFKGDRENFFDMQWLDISGSTRQSFVGTLAAVPEPSTWALILVGFGFIGAAMRRNKKSIAYQYARAT